MRGTGMGGSSSMPSSEERKILVADENQAREEIKAIIASPEYQNSLEQLAEFLPDLGIAASENLIQRTINMDDNTVNYIVYISDKRRIGINRHIIRGFYNDKRYMIKVKIHFKIK